MRSGRRPFVIHHCTYEGTEIVRRETRPIDSLGSIPLGSSESCPHTFAGGATACSHDLPLLWLSLSHWLHMRVNSSAHDLTSSKGHTYRGYDTYDQAPLRTVLPSDDRHKWNANGASCSRAVAVYVATFTTSVLCKEGHVSYACIRNPRLARLRYSIVADKCRCHAASCHAAHRLCAVSTTFVRVSDGDDNVHSTVVMVTS